ncbi:MAG: beta-lactamase domain protein [Gallionellaceae bacterium]|nr:MAG: beta-lactamase domain protein [Gallionellaceae bacterium]
MRFALLGSGSEGNALVVQVGSTRLLMDCGFSVSETVTRLARLGLQAEQLNGILVTHEHGDHIAGVARLARKFGIPVWMTHGTLRFQHAAFADIAVTEINPHSSFAVGDIHVQPFLVPHDAGEPVQYVFGDGAFRLGVLTDTGHATPHIESVLSGCHALILECNHDEEMLRNGRYPSSLKQRVGGRFGHLNNQQSAALLSKLDNTHLQHIVAAHLSQQNNLPALAVAALSGVLGCAQDWIAVADQQRGLDWREIF